MSITVQPIDMFADNYAWLLRDSATGATAVVDPADADAVTRAVNDAGARLDMILLTHHHPDHVAGTDAIRARYGAQVIGAGADAYRLPRLDRAVAEGDDIRLGETPIMVLETPGHTIGHIAYAIAPDAMLFCGDTLFALGCGRLLEGTPAQLFASLARIAALPPRTRLYCGHEYTASNARFALHADPGNAALQNRARAITEARAQGARTVPSTLAAELATNPFLRAADVAEFARLRAMKDEF